MKRTLALVLSVMMLVGILSACGGGTGGTSGGVTGDEGAPIVNQMDGTTIGDRPGGNKNTDGDAVTITFTGWEASPLETASVEKGIATFEAANPDIKVEYTPTIGDYSPKILTMIAGDAGPDTFFLGTGDYQSFVAKGVVMDLTNQFNAEFSSDDFIDSAYDIMDVNGKIYGVSSCTVSPVIFYNKDIFDAAGEAYPPSDPAKALTWDEFRALAKRMTKGEGDNIEIYGVYNTEWADLFYANLFSSGLEFLNADRNAIIVNDNATVVSIFQQMKDIRAVDGSAPAATTLEKIGMNAAQMLQTGRVAMITDGSWALQELATMDFNVGVGVLPKMGSEAKTAGQAHVHSAWVKTPNPDQAWRFLAFLSSEEYQTDLVSEGLWMPNRKSLYTEEGIAKWYRQDVHGDDFRNLAPYFQNAGTMPLALYNSAEANQLFTECRDAIFLEGKDIQESVNTFVEKANATIK